MSSEIINKLDGLITYADVLDRDYVDIDISIIKEAKETIEAMQEAIDASMTALDDWLNTYAPEFCCEERVEEAKVRIRKNGGTLSYIAGVQEKNRNALGVKK